jgi:alginate O-acetyltransferase complex protein AlgI
MAFGSIEFLFYFLPLIWLITGIVGVKKYLFLTFSLIFYTWGEGIYVLLLILIVYINYITSKYYKFIKYRKIILILTLLMDLGVLLYFKYFTLLNLFINNGLNSVIQYNGLSDIHLPLGISFFIFQLISYTVDKYREVINEDDNFIDVLLYISMFPHQLAGPIVRYIDIKKYLLKLKITKSSFVVGLNIFIIGLSQKILIADTFAEIADEVFSMPPMEYTFANSWIGSIAYGLQIFFDFQGYSLMAAGLAIQFGIFFPRNFQWPYYSRSITEFWRRWHITLSLWFKDYVYIPLGGSKKGFGSTAINLLIVFILCGLWHGANLTFVLWGLYHGLFLSIEKLLNRFSDKFYLPNFMKHTYVLLVISIGWVLFRSKNLAEAILYIKSMFDITKIFNIIYPVDKYIRLDYLIAFLFAIFISTPIFYNILIKYIKWPVDNNDVNYLFKNNSFLINVIYYLLFIMCVFNIVAEKYKPFIYFRF